MREKILIEITRANVWLIAKKLCKVKKDCVIFKKKYLIKFYEAFLLIMQTYFTSVIMI